MSQTKTPLQCPAAKPYSTFTLGNGQFGLTYELVFNADSSQIALAMDFPEYGDGVAHHYYVFLMSTAELFTPDANLTPDMVQFTPLETFYQPQFSPDGHFLVTARSEHQFWVDTAQVQLWNPAQDEPLAKLDASTGAAAFSPKGDVLVTFDKGVLSVWDVNALAKGDTQPLATLDTDLYQAQEIAFSADGTRLYVRGNNSVLVYGTAAS
jgi:WD40 repeat protein